MRTVLLLVLFTGLTACEPEKPKVEDTVFQHALEYNDKAEQTEDQIMQGAEARRQAIEAQEQ